MLLYSTLTPKKGAFREKKELRTVQKRYFKNIFLEVQRFVLQALDI